MTTWGFYFDGYGGGVSEPKPICRVLPSIVNEVLKSVVAQYNAIELIVKREQVKPQNESRCELVSRV